MQSCLTGGVPGHERPHIELLVLESARVGVMQSQNGQHSWKEHAVCMVAGVEGRAQRLHAKCPGRYCSKGREPAQAGGLARLCGMSTRREIQLLRHLCIVFVQRLEPAASFFPPYWRCLGVVKGACVETLSCGAQSARCCRRSTR